MDPDEFEEYLASLPPEEQQRVLYDLGLSQANTIPGYSFGGPFAPGLSPQSYDLSLISQMPPDVEYGDVQPFGLDEQSQAYNILQDMGSASFDPAIAMFAGRGAFAPSTFEPITTPVGEPLDLANTRYVTALAQSQGGYESYLAQKMLEGFSSSGALSEMWKVIIAAQSPEADEETKTLAAQLQGSLPPAAIGSDPFLNSPEWMNQAGDVTTPQGRAATFDVESITEKADDLFERMTLDPEVGYVDPNTGLQYAGSIQEPSPITAKFAEYGLPTPQESYLDPQWLGVSIPAEEAARAQMGQEVAQAGVDQAAGIRDLWQSNFDQLNQAWQDTVGTRAIAATLQPGARPEFEDFAVPSLSPEENAEINRAYHQAYEDWQAGPQTPQPQLGDFPRNPDLPRFAAAADQYGNFQDALNQWQAAPQGEPPDLRDFYEGGPLPRFSAAYKQGEDYLDAVKEWEGMGQTAADYGTGNPYVVSSGNKVIDTYNFGADQTTPDERAAVSKLAETLYGLPQFGGYEDVGVGQMDQGFMDAYEQQLADTEQQWRDAMFRKYEADRQGWTGGYAGAQAVGAALAMEQMGRTPLNDILAQRTMSQQSFMPNMSMYGY